MSHTGRKAFACLAGAIALALSGLARPAAADEGRILLSHVPEADGGWDSAERRAVAELAALGLDVDQRREPDLSQCSDDAVVRSSIQKQGAIGAVELRRLPGARPSLRVCVVELVTGKATLRHFQLEPSLSAERAALLAVELVHASLLEVRAPHPSRGQAQATQRIRAEVDRQLAASRPAWLGLRLGASVIGAANHVWLAPSAGLWLGVNRFVLDTEGAFGVTSSRATSAHGSADLRVSIARTHAELRLVDRPRLSLLLGLGAGFLSVDVRGNASVPYRAGNGVATTFMGSSALVAAYAISHSWWLRADAHAGYCTTPISVTFADGEALKVGRPTLDAAILLEWRPP